MEQLLQEVFSPCTKVLVFDHIVRNAERFARETEGGKNPTSTPMLSTPGLQVHGDYTVRSGFTRARQLLEPHETKDRIDAAEANPEDPESISTMKMVRSASHLAEHFESYPLFLFSFCQYDNSGGSIWPAVWNACLAARTEGVGSAVTSVFFFQIEEMKKILGVPDDTWHFAACVSFGYPTGRWGVAPRIPVHEVSCRNSWDGDLGFEIPEPLFKMD